MPVDAIAGGDRTSTRELTFGEEHDNGAEVGAPEMMSSQEACESESTTIIPATEKANHSGGKTPRQKTPSRSPKRLHREATARTPDFPLQPRLTSAPEILRQYSDPATKTPPKLRQRRNSDPGACTTPACPSKTIQRRSDSILAQIRKDQYRIKQSVGALSVNACRERGGKLHERGEQYAFAADTVLGA
eukprot:gnl/TRDRNA2_/TRDRNA2_166841_c5_seq1.p1 gnl/TRDRNA2_/TRDRNA2_166841_c5~~gnl/TRDRNA2_/TRDRNA2_166841_c5_seq1.p1  ORF type:complete len:214 (+),score=28.00 gnl/TRDRNA2_/TRDRNA2_166841_c5_seq1:78-644(+)